MSSKRSILAYIYQNGDKNAPYCLEIRFTDNLSLAYKFMGSPNVFYYDLLVRRFCKRYNYITPSIKYEKPPYIQRV